MKNTRSPNFIFPIGVFVTLASGSPPLLVVDNNIDEGETIVSFMDNKNKINEFSLNSYCFNPFRECHLL